MIIIKKQMMWLLVALTIGTFDAFAAGESDSAAQALLQLQALQAGMLKDQQAVAPSLPAAAKSTQANSNTKKVFLSQQPNEPDIQPNKMKGLSDLKMWNKLGRSGKTYPDYLAKPNNKQNTITLPKNMTLDDVVKEQAFTKLREKLFPLSSEQTIRLHQKYNANEYALAAPAGTPPRPTATSQIVNLSPGSTPPVVRLAQGFVSSVVFLDSSGAPWPIESYDLGDPASFNIQWDKKSNTLMIQAIKLYNYGNMAIKLHGLNTPVMLTLVPGQKAVDYRVDMRVQGYGPNAKHLPTGRGLPASANNTLLNVLDGVAPMGSNRLQVNGGPAKAWILGDKLFVRTRLTVLSPGWISTMTSADGTHAYEMQRSPVLLVSWHGKLMQLKIEGL